MPAAAPSGFVSFYGAGRVSAEHIDDLKDYARHLGLQASLTLGPERAFEAARKSWSREAAAAHEAGHCIWYVANGVGVRRVCIRAARVPGVPFEVWGGLARPFRPVVEKCGPDSPFDETYGFAVDKLSGWAAEVVLDGHAAVVSSHDEIAIAALAMENIAARTGVPVGVLMVAALGQLEVMVERNRAAFDALRRELAERRKLEAGRLRVLLAPVQPWTYRDAWRETFEKLFGSGFERAEPGA